MKRIVIIIVLMIIGTGIYLISKSNLITFQDLTSGVRSISTNSTMPIPTGDLMGKANMIDTGVQTASGITVATKSVITGATIQASDTKITIIQKDFTSYKKPSYEELKKILTDLQLIVTQKEGTESPYQNAYRNNHETGIYIDIVSGEPLFSSLDKYDSQTGRPSFTKPLVANNIIYKVDTNLGEVRTEVRSKYADSHLGHVFDDGPQPTGKRFCINSASLKFIPLANLEKEGYGEFIKLFQK